MPCLWRIKLLKNQEETGLGVRIHTFLFVLCCHIQAGHGFQVFEQGVGWEESLSWKLGMACEEEPPGVPELQGEDETCRFLPTFDFHSCHCLSYDAT